MKITKSRLKQIIKEEQSKILTESTGVSQTKIENLTNAMMEIFYAVEEYAKKNPETMHPDDIPLAVKEVIDNEVAGFAEWLGMGMEY